MTKIQKRKEEIARKIQEVLSQEGIKSELDLSEHEATVYASIQVEEETLRIVAQLTDREIRQAASGPAPVYLAKVRSTQVFVRPSLGVRSASKLPSKEQKRTSYSKTNQER
jgi:hypothetical protein